MAQKNLNIFSNPFTFCQIQLKSELFKIETFQTFFYIFLIFISSIFLESFLNCPILFQYLILIFIGYFPIFRNSFQKALKGGKQVKLQHLYTTATPIKYWVLGEIFVYLG